MRWIETEPIPRECQVCREEDCYNCDIAGKRWVLSRENELRVVRKSLLSAIARMQRRVEEIDRELNSLADKKQEVRGTSCFL